MRTLQYLTGPDAPIFVPVVVAGVAIALACGLLSVFVVLKRLAFIGHGISHAAFGGVGVAAILGLATAGLGPGGVPTGSPLGFFLVVGGFCLAAALFIGWITGRRGNSAVREDSVIGMTLVASMAVGALLLNIAAQRGDRSSVTLEGSLFGSIVGVGPRDAAVSWLVALAVMTTLWLARRPMVFWAFDESAAKSFGLQTGTIRLILMGLLGIAIVSAMKLAGVILATALLILPGAIALLASRRLVWVVGVSVASAVTGVLGGLVMSFETDWPTGPCVVMVLCGLLGLSRLGSGVIRFSRRSGLDGPIVQQNLSVASVSSVK
jgi:ABC-type Mn2+/Zn2+ transport system permease subunit